MDQNAHSTGRSGVWGLLGLIAALCAHTPAYALYKSIGPDGRPIYSDRLLSDRPAQQIAADGSTVSATNLPYELRKVVNQFPVTLYSSPNCGPCDSGRSLLKQRGVPFKELTITTAEDSQALQKAEGSTELPILRIGGQRLHGYSSSEWTSYIDAAGYPKVSMLPPDYRYETPQALVPKSEPAGAASPASKPAPRPTPPSSGPTAPAGFKF